jgi:isopentenyl-diphosphate delta-isomerase
MRPDAIAANDAAENSGTEGSSTEPRHETLEWVDERNVVQGTKSRGEIHDEGLRHRSAHVAIFDAEGRLYLHRRSASKSVLPDHWDISSAGHVEPGEPYRDAAERELREELGLSGVAIEPLHVSDATEAVGWEFASLWHGLATDPSAIVPDPGEIAEGRFFSPEEIVDHLENPENKIAGTLALALTALVERADEIPALAAWSDAQRAAVAAAATSRPEHPDGAAPHAASMAALLEAETARLGIMPGVRRWLERALFLFVWLALAAVTIVFPIQFSNERMEGFLTFADELEKSSSPWRQDAGFLLRHEVAPWVYGGVDNLPLKETGVALVVLAGLPVLLALLLLRPATSLRRRPIPALLLCFAAWAAISWRFVLPKDWNWWGLAATLDLGVFLCLLTMAATTLDRAGRQKRMLFMASAPLAGVCLLALHQHFRGVGALPSFLDLSFLPLGSYDRQRMASTIGHNNGVAGLAVFLWFPCLAAIFLARGWMGRVAACAGAAALALMFLWLQTRAIWLVLAGLTPLFAWLAAKQVGVRPRLIHALAPAAALACLMWAQTVDRPWNPLRSSPPLVERLKQVTPRALAQSTQARIAAISLHYMPKSGSRFLFGNGLGSFAAVYPRMQKEYFAARQSEEVDLYLPSSKRTAQAHSDVLQVFVELGFVGLALVLAFFWFFAKRLEAAWEAAPDGRSRLWILAIAAPLCATLIHGVAEFPFHVASTAAYFCVFLGMLLAAEKAWGGRAPAAPLKLNAAQRLLTAEGAKGRIVRVAALVALLGAYLPAGLFATVSLRMFIADIYRKDAKSRTETYLLDPNLRNSAGGHQLLASARERMKQAFRVMPDDPETRLFRGHLHTLLAEMFQTHHQLALNDGSPPEDVERMRQATLLHSEGALRETREAEKLGNEFFRTHFDIALAYRRMARLASTERERAMFDARFEAELREANLFHPGEGSVIVNLLDRFAGKKSIADPEIVYWRRMLLRHEPQTYNQIFIESLHANINNGFWNEAHRYLAILRYDQPNEPAFAYAGVLLNCRQGEVAAARASLAQAKSEFPNFPLHLDYAMLPELTAKNWAAALKVVEQALAESPAPAGRDAAMLRAVQAYCAEAIGRADGPALVAAIEAKAREEAAQDAKTMLKLGHWGIRHLDGVVNTLCVYFDDARRAKPFLEARAALGYPAPDAAVSIRLARLAFEDGDVDTADRHLKEALIAMPYSRDANELIDEIHGAQSDSGNAVRRDAFQVRDERMKREDAREFARLQEEQGF